MAYFRARRLMNSIDEIFSKSRNLSNVQDRQTIYDGGEKFSLSKINAGSVLIPIVLFEILVCILGAKFYISIGYGAYSAITLALTIEVFYMYFSSKKDIKSWVIKLTLLLISVTTLSYSAYIKDANIIANTELIQSSINESKNRLVEITKEFSNFASEKEQIEKDMELYREFKKATVGNTILAPRRLELQSRRTELLRERDLIKSEIDREGKVLITQSFFSNFKILTIQTLISILAFTVVQIAICLALPDLLKTFNK